MGSKSIKSSPENHQIDKQENISKLLHSTNICNNKVENEINKNTEVNKTHHSPLTQHKSDESTSKINSSNPNSSEPVQQISPSKLLLDDSPSKESEVLRIIKKQNIELEDGEMINSCFTKHFFMRVMDKRARAQVINEMSLCLVKKGEAVFSQNSSGKFFYIIKEGRAELKINDKYICELTSGESFGELALLHEAPRSGTVTAISDCYLWVLERKNFKKIVDHINRLNYEENKTFIDSLPLLAGIDYDEKTILSSNMIKEQYEPGAIIVKEGEIANNLYVIKEGEVDCISNNQIIRTLKKGDFFGERAILLDCYRTMDIYAKTTCVCYSVSLENLKQMFGENYRQVLYLNFIKSAFTNSIYLKGFNTKLLEEIFHIFQVKSYSCGKVVVKKGMMSNMLTVIIEGNLVKKPTQEIISSRGSILYEKQILENNQTEYEHDLIAYPDCLVAQANLEHLTKLLNCSMKEIINKSVISSMLSKVTLFKNLTGKKLEILSEKVKLERVSDKKYIINQGETGNKFYIIKSGKVDIFVGDKYIRTLNENESFGERALFFNEARSANAIAHGEVELFYLEKESFEQIIESNLKEHLINRIYLQDNTIKLEDLVYIQPLGAGNYGQVSLVKSKKTNFLYAIKSISKNQIDHEQMHVNFDMERSVLLKIDHPFIVKLVKTLKDKKYIYFLMELIKGKELFDVIREIGLLNKYQTQFYGASMILAVEYLHERKFIYRDIKPENGYIKLIDFGTAKFINDRTSTIIGTPHYMAPEVVLGEGYSYNVDLWSIAICMYEFMCGRVPFGDSADDPMEVYSAIVNEELTFPDYCKDRDFRLLMSMMLSKNALTRLIKSTKIKNNIWFKNFDWDSLINLNAKPGYVPKIADVNKIEKESYLSYVETGLKEWQPEKGSVIDLKLQTKYDLWFEKF